MLRIRIRFQCTYCNADSISYQCRHSNAGNWVYIGNALACPRIGIRIQCTHCNADSIKLQCRHSNANNYVYIGIALACHALELDFNVPIAMPIQSAFNVGILIQAVGFTLDSHWYDSHVEHWFWRGATDTWTCHARLFMCCHFCLTRSHKCSWIEWNGRHRFGVVAREQWGGGGGGLMPLRGCDDRVNISFAKRVGTVHGWEFRTFAWWRRQSSAEKFFRNLKFVTRWFRMTSDI